MGEQDVHLIVDGRNVARSAWPNVPEQRLVELVANFVAGEEPPRHVAVVFDGRYDGWGPGAREHDERVVVVATRGESADDVIVREVEHLGRLGIRPWIVTSDRELVQRCSPRASGFTGGGVFLERVRRFEMLSGDPPLCASCGAPMVVRTARRGRSPGTGFFGCARFPECNATMELDGTGARAHDPLREITRRGDDGSDSWDGGSGGTHDGFGGAGSGIDSWGM